MTFLELFLRTAANVYRSDESSPGIVLAWLQDKECWYASLQRYPDGDEKVIQAKAYSNMSAKNAVLSLAWVWGNQQKAHHKARSLARHQSVLENPDMEVEEMEDEGSHTYR